MHLKGGLALIHGFSVCNPNPTLTLSLWSIQVYSSSLLVSIFCTEELSFWAKKCTCAKGVSGISTWLKMPHYIKKFYNNYWYSFFILDTSIYLIFDFKI